MLFGAGKLNGVGLQHAFLKIFALRRNVAAQIALHDERADRHTERGTESCVLHIDRNGDLRVVIRSEAHECRVVASVGVLSRTGFAADFDVRKVGYAACTAGHGHSHTFGNVVIPVGCDSRRMLFKILGGHHSVLYLLDYMGRDEMTAVGYGGCKVGYLQRCCKDLSLADRNRDNSVGAPVTFTVISVIGFGIWYVASVFAGQVNAEFVAVAH